MWTHIISSHLYSIIQAFTTLVIIKTSLKNFIKSKLCLVICIKFSLNYLLKFIEISASLFRTDPINEGQPKFNDKFQCLFIARAKEIFVAGLQSTGGSTGATVRDKGVRVQGHPGKICRTICLNTLFPGPIAAGGAGQTWRVELH